MSTYDLLGDAEPAHDARTASAQHLYRVAGMGAVAALVAWTGQPIVVALAAGGEAGGEIPDWAGVESAKWTGTIEALIFSGVGLGLLFFVLGTWQLVRLRSGGSSTAAHVGLAGGVVGSVAWFLTAAESLRMYTSIGAGIPDAVPAPELQKAVIEGTALDITASLLLFGIGYTAWLVLLATTARRVGVVGAVHTALIGLALVAVAVQLATPFSAPWSLGAYLLVTLVLGISFLVRSRR